MNIKAEHFWNRYLPQHTRDKRDGWIQDKTSLISPLSDFPILDLGCGNGDDAEFLSSLKFKIFCADCSDASLIRMNVLFNRSFYLDLESDENWQAFDDNFFGVIIANFSLNYSLNEGLEVAIKNIKRTLKPDGLLLARVFSCDNIPNIAYKMKLKENTYMDIESGVIHRFFDEDDIKTIFSKIGNLSYKKTTGLYNNNTVNCFDIVCVNKKPTHKQKTAQS